MPSPFGLNFHASQGNLGIVSGPFASSFIKANQSSGAGVSSQINISDNSQTAIRTPQSSPNTGFSLFSRDSK